MTREEFAEFVTAYGNASFDCGRYGYSGDREEKPYQDVLDDCQEAKEALLEAFDELLGTP